MKKTPQSKSKGNSNAEIAITGGNERLFSPSVGMKRSAAEDEEMEELLALDLEERRKRNIERNRQMLAQLFSIPASTTKKKEEKDTLEIQVAKKQVNEQESLRAVENKFPKFAKQLRSLSRYLSSPIQSSLILTGLLPSEEKLKLVETVCSIKNTHIVHINLYELTSTSSLINLCAERLLDIINIHFRESKQKRSNPLVSYFRSALSHYSKTLHQFIAWLTGIYQELYCGDEQGSASSDANKNRIVFVFEHYQTTEDVGIESPITLQMHESLPLFAQSHFGVILLTETIFLHPHERKDLILSFANYTEEEIKQIVMEKVNLTISEVTSSITNPAAKEVVSQLKVFFERISEHIPLMTSYGLQSVQQIYSLMGLVFQQVYGQSFSSVLISLQLPPDETVSLTLPTPPRQRLKELIQTIMLPPRSDSSRSKEMCENLPKRLKYLLLAAYLAHHNPQGTDNLKFLGEKTRKRRVSHTTTGAEQEERELQQLQRQQEASSQSSKLFSAERLFSIYTQLLAMSERNHSDKIPYYGRGVFQVQLETLIQRQLLWKPSSWNPFRPYYGSNISKALAESIATSLEITITDFLYDTSQDFPFAW